MKLRTLIFLGGLFGGMNVIKGQAFYGTTGLLHAPTAVMQKDKTVMLGGNMLDVNILSRYWVRSEYHPYTYNYYINCTLFPWLEVAYTCTLVKGVKGNYWPEQTWGKFRNQDRNFSGRLRLWKEGWWKPWTPQIVLGANDALNNSWTEGSKIEMSSATANGFYSRYYLAVTKHLSMKEVGEWGLHLAYVYNRRKDYPLNGPAIGANFRFSLSPTSFINKAINNLNLMAEYDSKSINCSFEYSFWKDYINAVVELNRCKYFSGGLVFKIHLK